MKKKTFYFILFTIIVFIGVILISEKRPLKVPVSQSNKECNITETNAVKIVKDLPEVREYSKVMSAKQSNVQIIPALEDKNTWSIHVYEDVNDSKTKGHTATFNWYSLDCSGKIKCSFNIYDKKGEFVRVSNDKEYPCK